MESSDRAANGRLCRVTAVFGTPKLVGTIAFYLFWPLLWVYVKFRVRANVLLVVEQDGSEPELLLTKNWLGPNSWTVPGGGVDQGETGVEAGLRELGEELGFNPSMATDVELLTPEPVRYSLAGLPTSNVYIKVTISSKPEITENHEIMSLDWVPVEEGLELLGLDMKLFS